MRSSRWVTLGILMLVGCGWLRAQTPGQTAANAAPVEDIRDIRVARSGFAPQHSPEVLAVVGLMLPAGIAYAIWRRRRPRLPAATPYEVAMQRLEQACKLMQPSTSREFGGLVSDVVRSFIEVQLHVTVTQRTTQEFLQDLMSASSNPLAQQTPLLAEFLHHSDMIKFAGAFATLQSLESLLRSARQLVRETAHAGDPHAAVPST